MEEIAVEPFTFCDNFFFGGLCPFWFNLHKEGHPAAIFPLLGLLTLYIIDIQQL